MLTVALKELRDALRDTRSLASSIFYCLMGPAVVWMVSLAPPSRSVPRKSWSTRRKAGASSSGVSARDLQRSSSTLSLS